MIDDLYRRNIAVEVISRPGEGIRIRLSIENSNARAEARGENFESTLNLAYRRFQAFINENVRATPVPDTVGSRYF